MKFEYEITDGDCVEKKTFGGQNLKKKTNWPWHTAKFVFAVCEPQAYGKPRLCHVPNGRTRQTLTARSGRYREVSFCCVPCFWCVLLTTKICSSCAWCLPCATHDKGQVYRMPGVCCVRGLSIRQIHPLPCVAHGKQTGTQQKPALW